MDNILDKLFMDILESYQDYGLKRQMPTKAERDAYEKFESLVSGTLQKEFNDFIESVILHETDKAQELFELGFKMGARFAIDTLRE